MQILQNGYGTFFATDREKLKNALHYAIEEYGIRCIDCAWSYFNQEIVGEVLQEIFAKGKIKRNDVFITSKLWNTHHRPDLVEKELKQTLGQLKLDYIDLFLIHTPVAFQSRDDDEAFPKDENGHIILDNIDILDTYKAMEDVQRKGLTRFIGVSNFNLDQLQHLYNNCTIKPYAIQNECHLYNQQKNLLKYCEEHNIYLIAHTTIGRPPTKGPKGCPLIEDPVVVEIANSLGVKPSQVCIKYLVQKSPKYVAIPMSLNPINVKSNSDMNFMLDEKQMKQLEKLDSNFNFEMPKKHIKN